MLLIGSRALKLRAPTLLRRQPADFDFVCTEWELDRWLSEWIPRLTPLNGKKAVCTGWANLTRQLNPKPKFIVEGAGVRCEFEIIRSATSSEILADIVHSDPETLHTKFGSVPTLDMLYTLKASHKHLKDSPFFWKTLGDYHLMMMHGARVRPEYRDFLRLREKETYTYKHPSLEQDRDGFFSGDGLVYVYDHDSIHEAVKVFVEPAYRKFQRAGAQVAVDKEKFLQLPYEVQLASVIEESSVLAIERSLVPHPGVLTPEDAWRFAFSKVLTSITSGWWRAFAYDNAMSVLKWCDKNDWMRAYWSRFQQGIQDGVVIKL